MSKSVGRGKNLGEEPMHLGLNATTRSLSKITGMDWYQQYESDTASDGKEGRLVSMHEFSKPWNEWEMHPFGEEAVICVAGEIFLHQDLDGDGANICTTVLQAGQYAVNPKGIWHTADVSAPCSCIFITPGQGTQNRPRIKKADGE
jgi:hypothetical protein